MGDFYLTLPSNSSMEHYPKNNNVHYFTDLPQTIDLSGRDYEVGLAEIQFPKTYTNVQDGDLLYARNSRAPATQLHIPGGLYETPESLISAINTAITFNSLGKEDESPTNVPEQPVIGRVTKYRRKKHAHMLLWKGDNRLEYNPQTKKATLILTKKGSFIRFDSKLSDVLGFTDSVLRGPAIFNGSKPVDIHKNTLALYVYCCLVEHRVCGDYKVPLLRVIPTVNNNQDLVYRVFEKPHYHPISRNQFNTIEILLNTDRGEKFSFGPGSTIVTLHIRPRKK